MENQNSPNQQLLKKGASQKILQVSGKAGMLMPEHHSTHEAVVLVQKGRGKLHMQDQDYILMVDEPFIIPAGERHSLELLEDFQALVIMATDASIAFKD